MIWIVLCDGANAKIFTKESRFDDLKHLESFTHTHELTHEHGRDKPGRGFGSNKDHHAYESETDWHELQKHKFMQQIAFSLLIAFKENKFSRLYFISPAKLAGTFRSFLDQHLDHIHKEQLKITEIHKDLTHNTTQEINEIILKEEGWN